MPDLVTITIDEVEYKVPAGSLLTDAAKAAADIDIPVFCSHPKLEPLGACRMCLVEQDVRGRWMIVPACTTRVGDGMKFRYASEAATQAREDTLEFILINHPLDCPICDKGGECPLQDQTLKHGPGESEFEEIKTHKEKRYPISDLIMLDQERCIVCWRCIRYLEEWEDKPQLGLFHRGGETVIDFFPEQPVDAKTSGNIIDLCPVGALTNRVSRFRYRPWELKRTKSICTHCSQGCNVRLDARLHQLRRIVARENMAVNDEWICDKGRFFHGFVDHAERLTTPLVRDADTGELRESGWDEALGIVAERLSSIADVQGPGAVGAIGSAKLSNEAAYLLQKLMRSLVGSNNVDHKGGAAVLADPRGLSNIRDVENADVIVLMGVDLAEEQPVLDLFVRRAVRRNGAKLVIIHPRRIEDTRYGGPYVAYKPGEELSALDGLSRALLKLKPVAERAGKLGGLPELTEYLSGGQISQELAEAARLLAGAQRPIILYGPAVVSGPGADANRAALMNAAVLAGCADRAFYIAPDANSIGVRDVGLLPNRLPGHLALSDASSREQMQRIWGSKTPADAGLSYDQMLAAAAEGRLKALYLVGSDPAADGPAGAAAVAGADFLVVQDMFLTASAQQADVVLPAVSWAETDGTFTNLERRVQRAPKALANPHSKAAADWSILLHLARAWPVSTDEQPAKAGKSRRDGSQKGKRERADTPKQWKYASVQEVLEEIGRAFPAYAATDWASLGEHGRQWAADSVPPVARRLAVPARPARAWLDDFPFALVTGRLLFDDSTLMTKTRPASAVATVSINPGDAAAADVQAGEAVLVASPAGQLELTVRIDDAVLPGTLWIPYSQADAPVETLLSAAGDGVGTPVRLMSLQTVSEKAG